MGTRLQLQSKLESLISNVYFQPPESTKIKYPCIVYSLNTIKTDFADDNPYRLRTGYTVTLIDANPDSESIKKIAMLPTCTLNRHFKSDNLNHYVYNIYY